LFDSSIALRDAPFVVFDFETTGLAAASDRVVEIGALRLEGREVTGHFATLVNPGRPIPPAATAVHGIADADVAGAPTPVEAFPLFASFARDAVLAAYNLPFDLSFYAAAAAELALPAITGVTVDILGLARHFIPGLQSYQLGGVAAALAITNPAPHRALGDVAVESQLLLAFAGAAEAHDAGVTLNDFALLSRGIPAPAAAAAVAALEWAIATAAPVAITYAGKGGPRRRRVSPLKIKKRRGVAYVVAYCHEAQGRREFRLDRLTVTAGEADTA
jgi:DNA polymerase-3 subunit epsilon